MHVPVLTTMSYLPVHLWKVVTICIFLYKCSLVHAVILCLIRIVCFRTFDIITWWLIMIAFPSYHKIISPPPPCSAGAGDYWIRVRLSVCLSVRQQFLFRARSPILLGGIDWNLAQWKNIYCSCAPGYRFYRAAKNMPVGLGWKSRFFLILELQACGGLSQFHWHTCFMCF